MTMTPIRPETRDETALLERVERELEAPRVLVVRGRPAPEEAAAAIAVVRAALGEARELAAERPAPSVSRWNAPERAMRAPLAVGRGAWRSFTG